MREPIRFTNFQKNTAQELLISNNLPSAVWVVMKLGENDVGPPKSLLTFATLAFLMVRSCWAITDSTSMSILLNSSKQHQAPDWAKPEKNRPIILKSNPSEQLNTTHCLASALAKSYTRQEQVFSVMPWQSFLFKGHSQLAHMRIRYHFTANLHITETRSILFLTNMVHTTI